MNINSLRTLITDCEILKSIAISYIGHIVTWVIQSLLVIWKNTK